MPCQHKGKISPSHTLPPPPLSRPCIICHSNACHEEIGGRGGGRLSRRCCYSSKDGWTDGWILLAVAPSLLLVSQLGPLICPNVSKKVNEGHTGVSVVQMRKTVKKKNYVDNALSPNSGHELRGTKLSKLVEFQLALDIQLPTIASASRLLKISHMVFGSRVDCWCGSAKAHMLYFQKHQLVSCCSESISYLYENGFTGMVSWARRV